jgi:hypothetical protein
MDLLPKHRKQAIHWLRPTMVETAMFGKVEMMATACGVTLDGKGWESRAATEPHRVTCEACHAIANPKRSPFDFPAGDVASHSPPGEKGP